MKILLSNAPWYSVDFERGVGLLGCRAGSRWPHMRDYHGSMVSRYQPFPFFLATASAMLKQQGFDVIIRDSIVMGETYESYYHFIENQMPDMIVLEVSTPSIINDLEVAKHIRTISEQINIVLVGLHAPLGDISFLQSHSDITYTIYGEYEHPLMLLAKALSEGTDLAEVPNLVYRKGKDYCRTEREQLIPMDSMPWPDRESLPSAYYDGCGGMLGAELQIHTSRGCPFGCNFCVLPQVIYAGPYYRLRDPQDVVDEILVNMSKAPYTHFYIDDDTINIDRNHFMELCRLFRENELNKIPWACMGRGDLMDDEMLLAMKEAGCYSIKYGIESFDPYVLSRSGKNLDLEKVIDVVYKTQELGIRVHVTYCLGMLGDTVDSVRDTITKSLELESDSRQYSIATPFVGSRLWEEYQKQGLVNTEDFSRFDANHDTVIDRPELPAEELIKLKQYADEQNKEQLLKRVTSQYRTQEFISGLREVAKNANSVLITGTARIPVLTRAAEYLNVNESIIDVIAFEQLNGTSLSPKYDIAIIFLRTFNTSGNESILKLIRGYADNIVLVYGNAKIEKYVSIKEKLQYED